MRSNILNFDRSGFSLGIIHDEAELVSVHVDEDGVDTSDHGLQPAHVVLKHPVFSWKYSQYRIFYTKTPIIVSEGQKYWFLITTIESVVPRNLQNFI